MGAPVILPSNFEDYLDIPNARQRFQEAREVAEKVTDAGIALLPNMDHAAIFVDPPHILAGPLKKVGYVAGWDARCYPSPVDGQDYINVPSGLPSNSPAKQQGWFNYVAVVHPVDDAAREQMLSQGYGNPFVHHLTWGIVPPERDNGSDDFAYAGKVIPFMVKVRAQIGDSIGEEPGTLIMALPEEVVNHSDFQNRLPQWLGDLHDKPEEYMVEPMQGGGFLIQFFVLTGGRIEVALRVGTTQTFNPKSVHKISEDEISTVQNR
ncbi:MAG: hypothetical protein O7G87_12190 [bacterium]|nr:hypothetical protein [bacterium]